MCYFSLTSVELDGTNVSDGGVLKVVLGSPRLVYLGLGRCDKITGRSLEHVAANLQHLASISLGVLRRQNDATAKFLVHINGIWQLLKLGRLRRIVLSSVQTQLRCLVGMLRPNIQIGRDRLD